MLQLARRPCRALPEIPIETIGDPKDRKILGGALVSSCVAAGSVTQNGFESILVPRVRVGLGVGDCKPFTVNSSRPRARGAGALILRIIRSMAPSARGFGLSANRSQMPADVLPSGA